MVGCWRGERGQGRRTVAFILTLDAALRAGKLGPGTKLSRSFCASFLDGGFARFGPGLHGFAGLTSVLRRRKKSSGNSRPHPSVYGHRLRPSLTTLAVSWAWWDVGVGSGVKGAVLWRSS